MHGGDDKSYSDSRKKTLICLIDNEIKLDFVNEMVNEFKSTLIISSLTRRWNHGALRRVENVFFGKQFRFFLPKISIFF